jgi:hypothetical protein
MDIKVKVVRSDDPSCDYLIEDKVEVSAASEEEN